MNDDFLTVQHQYGVLKDWTTQESYRIIVAHMERDMAKAVERILHAGKIEDLWESRGAIKAIRELRSLPESLGQQMERLRRAN